MNEGTDIETTGQRPEQTPESELVNRAATVVLAAMIFSRMEPSQYVDIDGGTNHEHATRAFNAAEAFMAEAVAFGYDAAALSSMKVAGL